MKKFQQWTPAEFRAVCVAWHGGHRGWRGALATELGIDLRTVRRWAAGRPLPENQQLRIMSITGMPAEIGPPRRCDWIIGTAIAGDFEIEYLIHAAPPRFICRIVDVDDAGLAAAAEGDADLLTEAAAAIDEINDRLDPD